MTDDTKPRRWAHLSDYFTALQFFIFAVRVWIVATAVVTVGALLVHFFIAKLSFGSAMLISYVGGTLAAIVAIAAYLTFLLWPQTETGRPS